ncbi:nitrate- and nitrite sensing domain-containing protein [Streptomyces sp. N50]|uniref:sensor histidine kinase n=1 Tax=Streptomyces sp. N50 TaxID=3081765 RepID=UPI002961F293|nr:nitrate- and nitrite sensing domain-containing protein [Streptomyces sp. N50]WOX09287.1 nitrate- and nitrite sensing domain-containing protein [Streptomyces sp. N50]
MSRHRGTAAPADAGARAGRGRSIRASLITLAVVPATAMVLLWASGSAALFNQWNDSNKEGQPAKTTYALVPAVGEFQKERQLTVSLLASHGSPAALVAQRRRTDAVLAGFRKADAASAGAGSAQYQAQLATVRKRLTGLTAERTAVDDGKTTRQQAYTVYSDAVSSALNLFGMLSTDSGDAATAADASHALAFLRGAEALSQEEAILDGVAASRKLSVQERSALAAAQAVRVSVLSNEVEPYLSAELGAELDRTMGGQDWAAMTAFEKTVASASAGHDGTIGVSAVPAARAAAPGRVSGAVQAVEGQFLLKVTQDSAHRTHQVLVKAMLGSALAFVAVLAVGLLSWRITRSLIGRMSGLRAATLELAEEKLPELITRLRTQGKRAELDDLPELDYGTDELGKVAEAFNSAQRTAVSVALEQAALREGARLVFHNMSRRIQLLVHRQLTVIDSMERKEQDPQLLSDLYRVDHLATRMRRNAESLTVLSGASPRRRWKQAVPLAELLRSAVSEIEGYTRVVVEPLPPIAVLGPAVGDTIHLMAELIENGVTFSPPHTEVRVRALPVAQGYAVEVEDRGLGLSADEYAAANELLHHPKDFSFTTLGEDPRLGLFTVGHLAQRHGITASLQASSYGGSLAVVVVPHALTESAADTMPPTLDARAERHLASVAGSLPESGTGSGTGSGAGSGSGSGMGMGSGVGMGVGSGMGPGAGSAGGTATGPVSGSGRGGVTAGGMPMRTRTRTAPHAQPQPAPHAQPAPHGQPQLAPHTQSAPHGQPQPAPHAQPAPHGQPQLAPHAQPAPHGHSQPAPHTQPASNPAAPIAEAAPAVSPRGAVPFPHPRAAAGSGSPSDPRPAVSPAGPRTGGPGSSRLPRRVRQAHLAPQLRERPDEADGERGAGREAERRPEQARSMLAALRDGTRRAREQEDVPTPAWPSSLRGDTPWPKSPRGDAPRPASPQAEAPAPTWNTAPPERRQLPTRPRPTRNTP